MTVFILLSNLPIPYSFFWQCYGLYRLWALSNKAIRDGTHLGPQSSVPEKEKGKKKLRLKQLGKSI